MTRLQLKISANGGNDRTEFEARNESEAMRQALAIFVEALHGGNMLGGGSAEVNTLLGPATIQWTLE